MKRHTQFAPIMLLGVAAMLLLSACAAPVTAQSTPGAEQPRTISVVGSGIAYGSPDVATVQVGVQTRGTDPGQAVSTNSERMEALIAAIRAMGIAQNDIQTTNFSVYAQQDYDPRTGQPSETITYVVDNTVSITVRDLEDLGDVLTGAVSNGANSVYGVSFSVADRGALEAEAREKAMADARARAQHLAQVAGVTLGEPHNISEQFSGGGPIPVYYARDAAVGMGGQVPVETGQIGVNLQVAVTYVIR
jgi:uncharacterized protein